MNCHCSLFQLMKVVSSAYFTIEFSRCLELQSWAYSVNTRGLSIHPWGLWHSVLEWRCDANPNCLQAVLCGSPTSNCSVSYSSPECSVFQSASWREFCCVIQSEVDSFKYWCECTQDALRTTFGFALNL